MPAEVIYICGNGCGEKTLRNRLRDHLPKGWVIVDLSEYLPPEDVDINDLEEGEEIEDNLAVNHVEFFCSATCFKAWVQSFTTVKALREQWEKDIEALK